MMMMVMMINLGFGARQDPNTWGNLRQRISYPDLPILEIYI